MAQGIGYPQAGALLSGTNESAAPLPVGYNKLPEFAGVGAAAVPVMATTGPGGGNRLEMGSRGVTVPSLDGRWRQMSDGVSAGELVTDFGPGGIATAVAVSLGGGVSTKWAVRRDVLTLPDGRTVPALVAITPFNRQTLIDITIPARAMAATDVIEVQLYIPANQRGVQGAVHITADGMLNYLSGNMEFESRTTLRHTASGFVTLRFPKNLMTATGTVAADAQINQIRLELQNTLLPSEGEIAVLGVWINRREQSKIIFCADDGFLSDIWLADELGARGLPLVSCILTSYPDNPPSSGYMTWTDIAALARRNNVQITSHSHTNIAVNGRVSNASMYGASAEALAVLQSVAAGAVTLNGTVGTAAFDRPRHVTISCSSGNNISVYWDIVGEYRGSAVRERIWAYTSDAGPRPTKAVFDRVTSITCSLNGRSALGAVRFGTSMSYDEIYYDIERSFIELESRGLSDPLDRHFIAPYGMTNETLFRVLRDLGVKTCRATKQHLTAFGEPFDVYTIPSVQWDLTNYTNKPEQLSWALDGGASLVVYTHKVLDSGAVAGEANKADLTPLMDLVATAAAAGRVTAITMSDLHRLTHPSGPGIVEQSSLSSQYTYGI